MSCGHCGPNISKEEDKHEHEKTYQCQACGRTSEEEDVCCGINMQNACRCETGRISPDCCDE